MLVNPADRIRDIDLSLIRQINALATPDSINLGIGEPNVEPDDRLREMARRASDVRWRYSPNAGMPSLRTRLCEGTPFDPQREVCVTAGTQEALFAVFTAFVNPGDEVLVPDPGFLSYATLARICGATVVRYELDPPRWDLDAEAVERRVTSRTKLIVVNSPSNPLGAVADRAALERIAATGRLVVSDEVYRDIWYQQPAASMLGMAPNVLTVSGLSKSHAMTGLRIGWIHGAADLLDPITKAHQYITTCASVVSQSLAEMILGDVEWNCGWLARVRAQFRDQRQAALERIAQELESDVASPQGAFYIFAPVPSCDTTSLAKRLATEAAVLVIPGVAFGKRGEGFIRISYAAPVDEIAAGIARIGSWLRDAGL